MTNDEPRLRISSLHMPSKLSPNWSGQFQRESTHPNTFYVYAPWTHHRRRLNLPSRLLQLNFQPTLSFVGRRRSRFLRSSMQKPLAIMFIALLGPPTWPSLSRSNKLCSPHALFKRLQVLSFDFFLGSRPSCEVSNLRLKLRLAGIRLGT